MSPTDRPTESTASAQDYIRALLAQGMTKAEIARQLQRSPRLVGMVAAGQKPGHNLTDALAELSSTGTIAHEPPRRLTASGEPARVRGRQGQASVRPALPAHQRERASTRTRRTKKPRTKPTPDEIRERRPTRTERDELDDVDASVQDEPDDESPGTRRRRRRGPSRSTDQPGFTHRSARQGRNTFTHEEKRHPTSGREFHRITGPKARWSFGRWEANDTIADIAARAARGLRRMHATVWVEVGKGANRYRRPVQLGGHGGYDAQSIEQSIRVEGGDALEFFASQVVSRYPELEGDDWVIVGVDLDVW